MKWFDGGSGIWETFGHLDFEAKYFFLLTIIINYYHTFTDY